MVIWVLPEVVAENNAGEPCTVTQTCNLEDLFILFEKFIGTVLQRRGIIPIATLVDFQQPFGDVLSIKLVETAKLAGFFTTNLRYGCG